MRNTHKDNLVDFIFIEDTLFVKKNLNLVKNFNKIHQTYFKAYSKRI